VDVDVTVTIRSILNTTLRHFFALSRPVDLQLSKRPFQMLHGVRQSLGTWQLLQRNSLQSCEQGSSLNGSGGGITLTGSFRNFRYYYWKLENSWKAAKQHGLPSRNQTPSTSVEPQSAAASQRPRRLQAASLHSTGEACPLARGVIVMLAHSVHGCYVTSGLTYLCESEFLFVHASSVSRTHQLCIVLAVTWRACVRAHVQHHNRSVTPALGCLFHITFNLTNPIPGLQVNMSKFRNDFHINLS
jgi:hypothetical protein